MIKFDKTKKIHEQISPETWCQEFLFANDKGHLDHDNVCKACAMGYVKLYAARDVSNMTVREAHEYNQLVGRLTNILLDRGWKFDHASGKHPLARFNDSSTFSEVRELFQEADI